MANVVRLVSGGTIQVRTGVIQGIGPQGPRGLVGPQGIDGAQGPQGEPGEMGQILEASSRTAPSGVVSIPANTDTLVGWGAPNHDLLSAFPDSTNIDFLKEGHYLLTCWLRFDDAAAGSRDIWFRIGTTTIARTGRYTIAGAPAYVDLSFVWRTWPGSAPERMNVYARSTQATAIGAAGGALTVTRVGSGPPGSQGPEGPQGGQGPQGIQGIQGEPGNAASGFGSYGDLYT